MKVVSNIIYLKFKISNAFAFVHKLALGKYNSNGLGWYIFKATEY